MPACLLLLLLLLLTEPIGADDLQVTILRSSDAAPFVAAQQGLIEGLDGHRIRHVIHALDDSGASPPEGLVIAIGSLAAATASQFPDLRMVYCLVADPAEAGLLDSEARVRGVPMQIPLAKQFALCAMLLPRGRRIGMLYTQQDPASLALLEAAQAALPPRWSLDAVAVDDHAGAADAIAALIDRRVDIIWTGPDASVYNTATVRSLLVAALRHRVPVFGFSSSFVRAGALIGVGIDPSHHGRQAADLAQQMLTAQTLPSDPEPAYEVYINQLVAQQIRMTIPRAVLDVAEEVQHDQR